MAAPCFCPYNKSLDIKTPRNVHLTAFFRRSFAYYTMMERVPIIVTQTIDSLTRAKHKIIHDNGEESAQDLKFVISQLSRLKYEIQTNKPLRHIESDSRDALCYNAYIDENKGEVGEVTPFHSIWLLSECYAYRRLREAFEKTKLLKNFDPFLEKKEESFMTSIPEMQQLAKHVTALLEDETKGELVEILPPTPSVQTIETPSAPSTTSGDSTGTPSSTPSTSLEPGSEKTEESVEIIPVIKQYILVFPISIKKELFTLLKLNLWGNRCDLSLSCGEVVLSTFRELHNRDQFIICNHSARIWDALMSTHSDVIDIVMDNVGYEWFTDLCLADFLVTKGFAAKINFHPKNIPWFVSDVMGVDFKWHFAGLLDTSHESLQELSRRWQKYFETGVFNIIENDFWTLPNTFWDMRKVDLGLYQLLSDSKLIIIKGDLNYRKLFNEFNWDPTTPVEEAQGKFGPAPFCILRTVKCHMACGLAPGRQESLDSKNEKWMETGDYGMIQFSDKIVLLTPEPSIAAVEAEASDECICDRVPKLYTIETYEDCCTD